MCSVQPFNDANIEACNNQQSEPTVSVNLSSNTCKTLSMPDIVQKFSLNTEQTRTFRTVRSHVERTLEFQQNIGLNRIKPEQLLMYIGTYALFHLHF